MKNNPVYITKYALTKGIYKATEYGFINGIDISDGIKITINEGKTIEFFYDYEFHMYASTAINHANWVKTNKITELLKQATELTQYQIQVNFGTYRGKGR